MDAIIELGAHGTLEWLPGKAVALSEACAPEVALGPTPVVYPFIVNNPGRRRRPSAASRGDNGRLTPPLIAAGSHVRRSSSKASSTNCRGAGARSQARARHRRADPRAGQRRRIARGMRRRRQAAEEALVALDAWLCAPKDMRVGDGLHEFGRSPESAETFAAELQLEAETKETLSERVAACGASKSSGLLRALSGRFGRPRAGGRAGAPSSRRAADRAQSLRHRSSLRPDPQRLGDGRRAADESRAYAQDRRRPKRASSSSGARRHAHRRRRSRASLRAHRLPADLGCSVEPGQRLRGAAARDVGAAAGRCDVAHSGLFRDVFPSQIALFSAAVLAVAALEESADDNPLAGLEGASLIGVFGAARRMASASGRHRARRLG